MFHGHSPRNYVRTYVHTLNLRTLMKCFSGELESMNSLYIISHWSREFFALCAIEIKASDFENIIFSAEDVHTCENSR